MQRGKNGPRVRRISPIGEEKGLCYILERFLALAFKTCMVNFTNDQLTLY